jgi:hypothetical protein
VAAQLNAEAQAMVCHTPVTFASIAFVQQGIGGGLLTPLRPCWLVLPPPIPYFVRHFGDVKGFCNIVLSKSTGNGKSLLMSQSKPSVHQVYDELIVEATGHFGMNISVNDREPDSHKELKEHLSTHLEKYLIFPLPLPSMVSFSCPFCKRQLSIAEQRFIDEERYANYFGALEYCTSCHYWRSHHIERFFPGSPFPHTYNSLLSKARIFDDFLPEGISTELAQYIRRNQHFWNNVNPTCLEKLVADIFRSNHDTVEVVHVGKPDDGGVDVIFVDDQKRQWLIQVKRRSSPNAAEPVDTVRNLLGTMVLSDSTYGMVISTADHFTYRAYDAAKRAEECGMIVKLLDKAKLDRMLDPILPDRPWIKPTRQLMPEFADKFECQIPSTKYKQATLWEG